MKKFFWDVLLGRILPVLFFGAGATAKALSAAEAQRVAEQSTYATFHFANETAACLFFTMLTVSYVTRARRRGGVRTPLVGVVVVLTGLVSVAAAMLPHAERAGLELAGAILVALGSAYQLWALVHLRRSFSILPEARELVTTGPYAVTRHPLYLAETVALVGLLAPLVNAWVLLVVPFLFGQWLRARWEEAVLGAQFPEYAGYASRVPRFVPFLR